MKNAEKPFVFSAKARKGRSIRVIRINRVVALILVLAIIVSGFVVFFAIKANKSHNIDKRSYYFLQMGEFTSAADALAKSLELKNAGAAGYIINDGIFRVMATVFASENDAKIVQKKLSSSGIESSIFDMQTPKLKLGNYKDDNEIKLVRELAGFPAFSFFDELQKQDIALDAGESTDSAAGLAAGNLKKELVDKHEQIVGLLSKYPADKTLNALEKIYKEIIQSFENYLPLGEIEIKSSLKSVLCATVEIYIKHLGSI